MDSKPWAQWPLTLPPPENYKYGPDPKAYPEYQLINNPPFIAKMTKGIRDNVVTTLRKVCQEQLKLSNCDGIAIVLAGGTSDDWQLYQSDTDKANFRQESFFQNLFQVNEPDCYGVIDLSTTAGENGSTAIGIPFIPASATRWDGQPRPPSYYCETFGFEDAFVCSDANGTTQAVCDYLKGKNIHTVLVLRGVNTDSGSTTKTTANFTGIDQFTVNNSILYEQLALLQSIKTDLEVEYLRHCCNMSARAHTFVMANIKTCRVELQCEALFTAYCSFYGGSRANAYTCICASNDRGSVLHYGHARYPNAGLLKDGDMMVLDMGGEYNGYATDLTRSYPVNGKFTQQQRDIFMLVHKAKVAVFDCIKPGVFWPDMHRVSERIVTEGLHQMGVFQGDLEECQKLHVAQLVYPHGLGHLLGMDVHGVGGKLKCPDDDTCGAPGVCWLRLRRHLEKNMVLTVEPGIYFNFSWITDCLAEKPELKPFVNMEKLEEFRSFGGVRLEDDIVVTADGYEMLTGDWPSLPDEIEAVCAALDKQ